MVAPYPVAEGREDSSAEEEMQRVIDIVRAIRNARAQMRTPAGKWIEARILSRSGNDLEAHRLSIETLARARPLSIGEPLGEASRPEEAMVLVLKDAEVVIPVGVDPRAERERLEKQKRELQERLTAMQERLSDPAFLEKAPPKVVQKERDRQEDALSQLEKLEETLARLEQG